MKTDMGAYRLVDGMVLCNSITSLYTSLLRYYTSLYHMNHQNDSYDTRQAISFSKTDIHLSSGIDKNPWAVCIVHMVA